MENERSLSYSDEDYYAEKPNKILGTVKDYTAIVRETGKALQESGAIPEFSSAVREVAQVLCISAKEISKALNELKSSQVKNDSVESVKKIKEISAETVQSLVDSENYN